jgi:Tol biopolymer transport system component
MSTGCGVSNRWVESLLRSPEIWFTKRRRTKLTNRSLVVGTTAAIVLLASCSPAQPPDSRLPPPSSEAANAPFSAQSGSAAAENEIALVCHWDIFMGTVGTLGLVRLTGGPTKDSDPAFSPDTASIAFVRNEDIWVMASDGSNAKDLTPVPGVQADPTWSPDGSQLAYAAGGGIWIVNRDGSNSHGIPHTAGVEPSWSPDGKTIVFTSPGRSWALYTVSPTGSDLKLLREPPNLGLKAEDQNPTWYPDGTRISFVEVKETAPKGLASQRLGRGAGPPTIYSLYSEQQQRAATEGSGPHAQLLTLYRAGYNLYSIRPDGTGLRLLSNKPMTDPAWSPDSTQMAYAERDGIKILTLSTHRSSDFIRDRGCFEPSWG